MRATVMYGDGLYIRSVTGRTTAWFRSIQSRHEGRIRASGIEKESPLQRKWTPTSTTRSILLAKPNSAGILASSPES